MDRTTVFVKSAKGRQEIETRARSISENARCILLMINGQLTVEQVLENAVIFRHVEETIEQLFRAGYIVHVGDHAAAPTSESAEPAASSGGSRPSAEELKLIEREFVEFAGPIAGLLCEEVFATATSLDDALQKLSNELDPQQAKQFKQKVTQQLLAR